MDSSDTGVIETISGGEMTGFAFFSCGRVMWAKCYSGDRQIARFNLKSTSKTGWCLENSGAKTGKNKKV